MKKLLHSLFYLTLGLSFSSVASALVLPLPAKDNVVIGHMQTMQAEQNDDFNTIGRRFDVGFYQLVEANPEVNPNNICPGTEIIIPNRYILPNVARQGIVINLAELRLYYFPSDKNEVWTFPIGIGRQGWLTPLCVTHIVSKKEKPTWIVPKSIQADRAAQGVTLPDKVLPGPENPLGDYAMRLGLQTYLIHGTNDPVGVGRRSSAGCVRMFPEDIETLFKHVKVGTPVRIINEPYKIGWNNNKLYLEAHLPLQEQKAKSDDDLTALASQILEATHHKKDIIDWPKVDDVSECHPGFPECIAILEKSPQNDEPKPLAELVEVEEID